jgi:hypothetical protein
MKKNFFNFNCSNDWIRKEKSAQEASCIEAAQVAENKAENDEFFGKKTA